MGARVPDDSSEQGENALLADAKNIQDDDSQQVDSLDGDAKANGSEQRRQAQQKADDDGEFDINNDLNLVLEEDAQIAQNNQEDSNEADEEFDANNTATLVGKLMTQEQQQL